jgi:hypothetical protein
VIASDSGSAIEVIVLAVVVASVIIVVVVVVVVVVVFAFVEHLPGNTSRLDQIHQVLTDGSALSPAVSQLQAYCQRR